jgi:predicted phosphodiesterase
MRHLLLSDVHANAVALSAVLRHAQSRDWQQVIFLGDAVGYYPQAEEVVAALQSLPLAASLLGNHDAALLEPGSNGNSALVLEVLAKQRSTLSAQAKVFLAGLSPHARSDAWEAVHSTLLGSWDYVNSLERAQQEPPLMTRPLLFFGHTHVPIIYLFTEQQDRTLTRSIPLTKESTRYRLPPNARVLFNPGSVGQPRDGVPLAAYAIFDDEARVLEHYRVPFDIRAVQQLVKQAGYPPVLAARLERGR